MLQLQQRPDIAAKVDYWYVDGISLVRLVNLLLKKRIQRYSFDDTSIAPEVFTFIKKNNLNFALIGTEPKWIANAVAVFEKRFNIQATYFRDGFFKSNEEIMQAINSIKEKNIDVLICGMGTPRQENFLIQLKENGWQGYGFTCGGYLHQSAGKEDVYYPKFFDRFNIRWIYRIWDEPKLLSRYAIKYPVFFIKFLMFAISRKKE